MRRLAQALVLLLAGCITVRVVAWVITPALPMLVVLTLLALAAYRVVAGPRSKFDRFFK